jgi:hypothetical protein
MTNSFKPEKTYVNDIVIVHKEDNPQFFARVEDISEDIKPGWFHLKLLVLTIPVQEVTWILKDIYIDGTEFSMEGNRMKIEKVIPPSKNKPAQEDTTTSSEEKKEDDPGKVISFPGLKNQKE